MKKLLLSTRKGLLIYHRTNGNWKYESLHFKGIPVSLAYYDPYNDLLWAFQDHGHWGMKMQRSKDWGRTWEEVAAPAYPEGEEVKEGVPASLRYIWAANNSGTDKFWIGTEPGGLFESNDGAQTFSLNRGLWESPGRSTNWFGGGRDHPGIHSIVVDPRDENHLYIGISCAGVFESKDGGATWAVRNKGLRADFLPDPQAELGHDPHLLVQCKNAPDTLWQQNHCGIFRSTNGGDSWDDVSEEGGPAYFGFTIAADDNNPDLAWVVPGISDGIRVALDGALCVCRTEDGGRSWQAKRKGLPQENCFDIVYRHALAKSADTLVFGTTTGNVFHSNDGGESWEVLTNYVPMVYAAAIV